MGPIRISRRRRREITSGRVLLVCAYDSDERFRGVHLEGAIPLSEFNLVEKYIKDGYTGIKVPGGGVDAWIKAGFPLA
jgi:hypothetical protein